MNRDCPDSLQLQRWFDREASPDQRLLIARHVRRCEPCREVLRGFASVRRGVRALPLASASHIALARVRVEVGRLRQIELVGWLRRCTAAAAAVLVISLLAPALLSQRGTGGSPGNSGGDAGLVNQPVDETLTPGHFVAQWIVRDLSQG
jgi:hypothetical protein